MSVDPIIKKTAALALGLGTFSILFGASRFLTSSISLSSGDLDRFLVFRIAALVVVGAVVVVAAIALKRHKPWPRQVLEVSAWLTAVAFLLVTPGAVRGTWKGPDATSWVYSTLTILLGIFFAFVFTKAALSLRSPRVREALSESEPGKTS